MLNQSQTPGVGGRGERPFSLDVLKKKQTDKQTNKQTSKKQITTEDKRKQEHFLTRSACIVVRMLKKIQNVQSVGVKGKEGYKMKFYKLTDHPFNRLVFSAS